MKLSQICTFKQWKTISKNQLVNDGYPVYGANGIIGYSNEFNHETPTLMIGCRGTCGEIHLSEGKAYINGNAMCLDDLSSEFDINYVKYFLEHYDFSKIITGTAQPQITQQGLDKVQISKIPLEEQKLIASKITNIKELTSIETNAIRNLNSLIKSRFNEMFSNLNDYVTVQDSCEVHARIGWQALTQKEHMKTGKYMLITGTDFEDNEINYSSCVFVTKERYEMDRHIILRNDDVLITKDGTIGKVAIVHNLPGPATLNSGVFVLRPDNRFNKEYISYVFKGEPFSRFVEEVKTGVTVKHLNQANLLKFKIPVPQKKDQEHFALFLKTIDKLKFKNG